MIPIKLEVKRDHRVSAKEWRKISREAWEEAGEFWHARILPRKFQPAAKFEYGYEARSRAYEKRKQRLFGHRLPLVYTGDLKRMVTRIRDVRSVGDTSRKQGVARIVLKGPRYLFAFRRDSRQPDKAAELRAVSARDERKIARLVDGILNRELNERGDAERIRQ